MKHLNHFDRIYAYAEGQMDEGQRTAFEAELLSNEELREEYDAFLASQKALEFLALEELENRTADRSSSRAGSPNRKVVPIWRRRWMQVAAAAVILIGTTIWLWPGTSTLTPQEIAEKYYAEPNLSDLRGSTTTTTLNQAIEALEKDSLVNAIMLAGSVPEQSDDYMSARFLLGHAYFRSNFPALSAAAFAKVTSGKDVKQAEYNRAIALCLADEKEEAMRLLTAIIERDDGDFVGKAKEVLESLK